MTGRGWACTIIQDSGERAGELKHILVPFIFRTAEWGAIMNHLHHICIYITARVMQ